MAIKAVSRSSLAKKIGRSIRTIRRLEDLGAFPKPRTTGRQAVYDQHFSSEVANWPKELDLLMIREGMVYFYWKDGTRTQRPTLGSSK